MRIINIVLLFFAVLVLSSCEKPVPDRFACVKPISREHLERARLDMSCYQETAPGSGQYVPKGWFVVPDGPYKGCFVPYYNHDMRSSVPPLPKP